MENIKSRRIVSFLMSLVMTISMVFTFIGSSDTKVSAAASGTGTYVTTANLNLRASASTSSSILVTIPKNKSVNVTSVSGSWGKTTYSGKTGWIHLDYATKTTASSRATTAINSAKAKLGSKAYSGYCQKFVRVCFESAGIYGSASSAIAAWNQWKQSTSKTNIPVGACVYFKTSSQYGHVGIYIGNGQVIHAVSTVKTESLTSMCSKYTYLGWGYQGGVKP